MSTYKIEVISSLTKLPEQERARTYNVYDITKSEKNKTFTSSPGIRNQIESQVFRLQALPLTCAERMDLARPRRSFLGAAKTFTGSRLRSCSSW